MRVNDWVWMANWFRVKEASLYLFHHSRCDLEVSQAAEGRAVRPTTRGGQKWAGEFIYCQGPISARRSGWDGTSESNSFPTPVEDPAGPAAGRAHIDIATVLRQVYQVWCLGTTLAWPVAAEVRSRPPQIRAAIPAR